MTDLQGALGRAIYDRLSATITLAEIYQHVPENTPPPVVIIGDIDFEEAGSKGGLIVRAQVAIVAVTKGPGRLPLSALQGEILDALHEWRPAPVSGVAFGDFGLSSSSGQEIEGEREPYYYGQQLFNVFVQAV